MAARQIEKSVSTAEIPHRLRNEGVTRHFAKGGKETRRSHPAHHNLLLDHLLALGRKIVPGRGGRFAACQRHRQAKQHA